LYILIALLLFGFLIFIHEFGHFFTAKLLGVKVNEFSINMGPVLFQRQKGETLYSLRLIPIGGFCAMEGEDENTGDPRAFTAKSWWRRAIILVAGAFMNFLTGLVIVGILLATGGNAVVDATITALEPGSTLAAGGLQVGDRFYSIDGERVYVQSDWSMLVERGDDTVYDVVVIRDGQKVRYPALTMEKALFDTDGEQTLRYGVTFDVVEKTPGRVLRETWYSAIDFARMVKLGLLDLLSGQAGVDDMSGPVGIVSVIQETGAASSNFVSGLRNILYLGAFLAVNLAYMNLLPIPALDGGRVFFLLVTTIVEKVIRRRIDPKYEGYIHAAGMVLLLAFMAFVTFHDIVKLIGS
jgi:regulator of sigma E protease